MVLWHRLCWHCRLCDLGCMFVLSIRRGRIRSSLEPRFGASSLTTWTLAFRPGAPELSEPFAAFAFLLRRDLPLFPPLDVPSFLHLLFLHCLSMLGGAHGCSLAAGGLPPRLPLHPGAALDRRGQAVSALMSKLRSTEATRSRMQTQAPAKHGGSWNVRRIVRDIALAKVFPRLPPTTSAEQKNET